MMMEPMHANAGKRRAGYGLALIAVITCPCHLPILLLLLSGTAAGAFVTEYFGAALALLVVLFLFSVTAAMRLLQGNETEKGQFHAPGQANDARPERVSARPKTPGSREPRGKEEVIQSREHDAGSLRL
jgi:mercuric ion transport protein